MAGPYTPIDLSGNYSAIAPVVSHRNVGNPFWAVAGSGGGGGGSGSFSTINVSTIDMQANGDINWDGSVNFQGTNGGYLSLLSSFGGDNAANGIELTGANLNSASTIDMWVGADGKSHMTFNNPGNKLDMGGVNIANVTTINNQPYPPTTQTGISVVTPNNNLTYIKGGGSENLFSLPSQVAQHSYRIEMPVKIQGWNATDGNTNSYAPLPQDWMDFIPVGNVVGAPVFTTLQMAQVSSIDNDWEGVITGVWKTTNNGAELIQVNTAPSVTYSTSVQFLGPAYLTDLGAI